MTGRALHSRAAKPRGICILCGREVVLRKDGTVVAHYGKPGSAYICHGSGHAPAPGHSKDTQ